MLQLKFFVCLSAANPDWQHSKATAHWSEGDWNTESYGKILSEWKYNWSGAALSSYELQVNKLCHYHNEKEIKFPTVDSWKEDDTGG